MEGFDWGVFIAAGIPAVVSVFAALYSSWKAKVVNDGVQDWKDTVVKGADDFFKKVIEG